MFENLFNREGAREDKREEKDRNLQRELTSMNIIGKDDGSYVEMKQQGDLLRWQQELDDEIIKLRYRLKNMERDGTGAWVNKIMLVGYNEFEQPLYATMPPLCNDLCIQMIENTIEPLLSRNMINTNFDEKRILRLLCYTADELVDNLVENFEVYDIEFSNLSTIMRIIKNVMIPTPYRALNDGERRHQRTINKRIESYTESGQGQQKKTLGIF